ncbi:MAG TPA: hypothetical protein VI455_04085 [Terriglobia bacterium]
MLSNEYIDPVFVELLAYPKATLTLVQRFLEGTHVVRDFLPDETAWHEAGEPAGWFLDDR